MKSIIMKWKQMSATVRISSLIFAGTVVILSMTVGLRIWDKSQQKPRVIKAFKQLAEEISRQEYSLTPLLNIIQSGKTEQDGYVNLTALDKERLGLNSILLEWMDMEYSTIHYKMAINQDEKVLSAKMNYQIAGIGVLDINSYLTEEKLFIQLPQMHNSYLRMNSDNIKSQYEHSIWYRVLGDRLVLPKADLSVFVFHPFPKSDTKAVKADFLQAFEKDYKGRLDEIWKQITVTKENETKQILINGVYEDCRVFSVSFPAEIIHWYLNLVLADSVWVKEKLQERMIWEEDMVCLKIYMDDDNHIHRMDTTIQPMWDGVCYPVGITFYLRGEERLFDKVQIGLNIQKQTEQMELLADIENQYDGLERRMNFVLSQINTEKKFEIRAKLVMDIATGESDFEYEINSPFLISDGEHFIKYQNQPINTPEGEIVDIFELDLIAFLKFSSDFNFGLFR